MLGVVLTVLLAQAPSSSCAVSDEPDFGTTKERPAQVGGGAMYAAARGRRYLDVLRGPGGEPIQFKRLGSLPGGDERTILDRYELTYPGLEKPVSLYLDAYHYDDALKAPKGFTCAVAIALAPPAPDAFLAIDASRQLAVDRAARDVAPIPLDTDGSGTHGVIFDRFRMQTRAAKAAAAAGTPIDPKHPPREFAIANMVVVAFPLRCGDKPPVSPAAIDIIPGQGAAVKAAGELATGEALARLLPEFEAPPGAMAASYQLERPRPNDTIRIGYPDSGCGPANEVTLPMKYTNGRPLNTPAPSLPAGQTATDRPVLLQAMIDVDGSVQQVTYIGGPPALAAAAIDAVRGWTAEPAKLNGSPIVTSAMFQVRFTSR